MQGESEEAGINNTKGVWKRATCYYISLVKKIYMCAYVYVCMCVHAILKSHALNTNLSARMGNLQQDVGQSNARDSWNNMVYCHFPWYPSRIWRTYLQDPIAEDAHSTYFRHRAWRNRAGTDLVGDTVQALKGGMQSVVLASCKGCNNTLQPGKLSPAVQ